MKPPIYKPKGAALEYGDFAINIYDTCNHGCYYCYAKSMYERFHGKGSFCKTPEPRPGIIEAVKNQLDKEQITGKMIHLCFACDPYPADIDTTATREIIKLLKAAGNHVQILTKGGRKSTDDFDLLGRNDRYGVTFSGYAGSDIIYHPAEPNASRPKERMGNIMWARMLGIQTWVSFEPVLDAESVLRELEYIHVDTEVKIGKLNYHQSNINWHNFGHAAEEICKRRGLNYYIKDSLRKDMEADGHGEIAGNA